MEEVIIASIVNFFNSRMPYKNSDLAQELFFEDLILYITQGYQPLSSTKNVWLKRLVFRQCGQATFLVDNSSVMR